MDEEIYCCDECGCDLSDSDVYEYNGDILCEDCYEDAVSYIYRWVNGDYTFYKTESETKSLHDKKSERSRKTKPLLYYGIELETGLVHGYDKPIEWYISRIPEQFFAIHSDGSIRDGCSDVAIDMEIVSHPMTYRYLMTHKRLWENIFNMRKHSLLSYDCGSCGIHIHLSKNYFTEEHLYKFLYFIYDKDNRDFIRTIGQRNGRGEVWCSFPRKNVKDIVDILLYRTNFYGKEVAVNTYHSNTIEIRLFRGTLNSSSFYKNVEFVEALVQFSKINKLQNMRVEGFLNYIKQYKRKYINLRNFIKSKEEVILCQT